MKTVTAELGQIVHSFTEKLTGMPEAEFSAKPLPQKWSKKEVLGHLIDSAQNNLRRFITSQYEATPPRIVYEQDFWVAANQYQTAKKEDVIALWRLMNDRICQVLLTMPEGRYSNQCNTGHETDTLRSLDWLAADYIRHMKHHLNQIIPGSFDVIYP